MFWGLNPPGPEVSCILALFVVCWWTKWRVLSKNLKVLQWDFFHSATPSSVFSFPDKGQPLPPPEQQVLRSRALNALLECGKGCSRRSVSRCCFSRWSIWEKKQTTSGEGRRPSVSRGIEFSIKAVHWPNTNTSCCFCLARNRGIRKGSSICNCACVFSRIFRKQKLRNVRWLAQHHSDNKWPELGCRTYLWTSNFLLSFSSTLCFLGLPRHMRSYLKGLGTFGFEEWSHEILWFLCMGVWRTEGWLGD